MKRQFDVLAIGELNPDLILSGFTVDGPRLGTEQAFESEVLTLGSSTAIACVLMQRLGLKTAMCSMVGDDTYGQFCRDALIAEGVDISGIKVAQGQQTGMTISLSYPKDRMLLTRYGTMSNFGTGDIDMDLLHDARHLHVGSFFIQSALRPGLEDLFAAARSEGQTTSLDLGWDPSETWDQAALTAVLPHVSVIFPNKVELAAITGCADVHDGLERLHAMGAQTIALKLGADGALYSSADGQIRHPGFPATVIDTTGAGDSFNAGFLHAMLKRSKPADCLAHANACGALTVQATGGTGGLQNYAQVKKLLNSSGR
ncbi:sugar kinase [Abyssibius alkaniclasticus]|uniref:carbohydrate kinase family protein n=1 Tax=Abyssibius alkaniclasticus TaxID=2881234 RepID=UPI0023636725|nr:sugar kinase [Abyssibius alkaniclasticus]UPH72227.1 sugar kinase [Abyssibius alkaniclasticus]